MIKGRTIKHFLSQWVRNPREIGAIAPSSRRLAHLITDTPVLKRARAVVEIGPGTGAFTGRILERKHPDALFLAVEANASFASLLKARFANGVQIYHDSAKNTQACLRNHGRATCDCIICGMPWGLFDERLQEDLMSAIAGVLEPGGEFSTFSYLGGPWLADGRRFKKMLPKYFSRVAVSRTVWLNLPPAFVYRCIK